MNYSDSSFLLMLLILPSLFGLTLVGEGVNKVMNYDNHGWVGVCAGAIFIIIIILAYFILSSRSI